MSPHNFTWTIAAALVVEQFSGLGNIHIKSNAAMKAWKVVRQLCNRRASHVIKITGQMLSRVVCHAALVLDHSHNTRFVATMWHVLQQPKSWNWFNFRYLTIFDASGETVAAGPQVVSLKINEETLRFLSQHQIWCERNLIVSKYLLHDAVSTHKELGGSPTLRPATWIASWSDCFSPNLSAFHKHANLLVTAAS